MILHVCIIGAKQPTKKLMQEFDYFEVVQAMVFFFWIGCLAMQDVRHGVYSQPYLRHQLTELDNGHNANLLIPY